MIPLKFIHDSCEIPTFQKKTWSCLGSCFADKITRNVMLKKNSNRING